MLMSPLFIFLILNLYLMLGETLIKHHLSDCKTALRSPLCSEKLPWGKEEEKDNRQEFQVQFPENNSSCFCIIYPISQKELSLQHRIEAPLSEAKHTHTHTTKQKTHKKAIKRLCPLFYLRFHWWRRGSGGINLQVP